jgi:hypothetical protein
LIPGKERSSHLCNDGQHTIQACGRQRAVQVC